MPTHVSRRPRPGTARGVPSPDLDSPGRGRLWKEDGEGQNQAPLPAVSGRQHSGLFRGQVLAAAPGRVPGLVCEGAEVQGRFNWPQNPPWPVTLREHRTVLRPGVLVAAGRVLSLLCLGLVPHCSGSWSSLCWDSCSASVQAWPTRCHPKRRSWGCSAVAARGPRRAGLLCGRCLLTRWQEVLVG